MESILNQTLEFLKSKRAQFDAAITAIESMYTPPTKLPDREPKIPVKVAGNSKQCKKCGKIKSVEDFPINKNCTTDGRGGSCKVCIYAIAKARAKKKLKLTEKFRCEKCHANFSNKETYEIHMETRHEGEA